MPKFCKPINAPSRSFVRSTYEEAPISGAWNTPGALFLLYIGAPPLAHYDMIITDDFIDMLLHDLGNHLSATQSFLELQLSGSLAPEQSRQLSRNLYDLTKNTSTSVTNLLLWSRLTGGNLPTNIVRTSLSLAFEHVLDHEQSIAQNKRVSLVVPASPPYPILADPLRLQLILRNLVNNALKFTAAGGEVSLSTYASPGEAIVCVRDTGTGIAPSRLPGLFTLASDPTPGTRNEKGLGLGLRLCARLTALQHGRLWCESTPGEGSRFFLALPLA
ncbi:MAG TPA: HAMP domain-containing sensor histidine kinase [Dinghuibacter sp.]|uniref:sensor histidine kinase n=1 Tax=Dinghuibacter sp. TaxID=2024697 RepID=UPI002B67FD31|nr:HAMP domain-containing sensor histidine kinase [Dinghuibacter sp.]HTJ10592.1 HAMP domain-containing sensor histidine kinase [Dinghuibacter sp.]